MKLTKLSTSLLGIIVVLSVSTIAFAYQYYDTYSILTHSMETLLDCVRQNIYLKTGVMPSV